MNKINTFISGIIVLVFTSSSFAVPIKLDITFDDYAYETSFGIWANGEDVFNTFDGIAFDVSASSPSFDGDGYAEAGDFTDYASQTMQYAWDVTPGAYQFVIFDSYGDGLCCVYGDGSYTFSVDGSAVITGASFYSFQRTAFTVVAPTSTTVSEPSVLALFSLGLIGLAVRRVKKQS